MLNSLPVIKSHRGVNTSPEGGVGCSYYHDAPKFTVRQAGPHYKKIASDFADRLQRVALRETVVGLADFGNDREGMLHLRIVRSLTGSRDATIDLTLQQQGPDLYVELAHYNFRWTPPFVFSLTFLCVFFSVLACSFWLGGPADTWMRLLASFLVSLFPWLFLLILLEHGFGIGRRLRKDELTDSLALRGSVLTILYDTLDSFGIPKNDIVDLVRL